MSWNIVWFIIGCIRGNLEYYQLRPPWASEGGAAEFLLDLITFWIMKWEYYTVFANTNTWAWDVNCVLLVYYTCLYVILARDLYWIDRIIIIYLEYEKIWEYCETTLYQNLNYSRLSAVSQWDGLLYGTITKQIYSFSLILILQ